MPDLLVRLYDLPPVAPALERIASAGVQIRRALAPEKPIVVRWVSTHFSDAWASECEVAFARQPLSCFLAVKENDLRGFVAYEATCKNFLGPLGVHSANRSSGIGAALLLQALHAMHHEGYAYAIIGGAGPVEFFQQVADAKVIAESTPGIYKGILRAG